MCVCAYVRVHSRLCDCGLWICQGVESPKKSLASKFRFLAVNRLAYSSTKNLNKRSPYESPLSPSSSPSARKGGRPSSKRSSERRSPESFFKELQEEQRLREAALQQKKEELEQKEVAECTFTPKINKLPPNMSYRREAGFSFNKVCSGWCISRFRSVLYQGGRCAMLLFLFLIAPSLMGTTCNGPFLSSLWVDA